MKIKSLSFFLVLVCASWAVGQSDDFLQSIEEKREKLKPVMPLPSEDLESPDAKKTTQGKGAEGRKERVESKTMKPAFALPVEDLQTDEEKALSLSENRPIQDVLNLEKKFLSNFPKSLALAWAAFANDLSFVCVSTMAGGPGMVTQEYEANRCEIARLTPRVMLADVDIDVAKLANRIAVAESKMKKLAPKVYPIGDKPTLPSDLQKAKASLAKLSLELGTLYESDANKKRDSIGTAKTLYANVLESCASYIEKMYED